MECNKCLEPLPEQPAALPDLWAHGKRTLSRFGPRGQGQRAGFTLFTRIAGWGE